MLLHSVLCRRSHQLPEAASAVKCANAFHVMKTVVTKLAAMSSQQGKKRVLVRVAVSKKAKMPLFKNTASAFLLSPAESLEHGNQDRYKWTNKQVSSSDTEHLKLRFSINQSNSQHQILTIPQYRPCSR